MLAKDHRQGKDSESVDIEGTLALTGSHVKMSISTEDVVGVFEKPLQKLLLAVANVVKKIPTDYVVEIFENGIILTGGGSLIHGLPDLIRKVTGINTVLANNPIHCVANGTGVALENLKYFKAQMNETRSSLK